MDKISSKELNVNKCWSHAGSYLGKYKGFKLVGQAHDPDPEWEFEKGKVSGLGLLFTEVPCPFPAVTVSAGPIVSGVSAFPPSRSRMSVAQRAKKVGPRLKSEPPILPYKGPCYDATIIDGKYVCPVCKSVEEGSLRIITHNFDCVNKNKDYCRKLKTGGRRTRATKNARRKRSRYSRRN